MKTFDSPPSSPASKSARLAGYLAGGVGSTLLATPAADAAVVAVDINTISWTQSGGTPPSGTGIGGTSAGITFGDSKKVANSFISHGGYVASLDIYNASGRIGFDPDGNMQIATGGGIGSPHNFSTGTTINAASYAWRATAGDTAFLGSATQYSPDFGAGSFVGFRFGSGGTYYYGYIEVTWAYNGSQTASTFSILSMAYESTANTGILAGAGAPLAVPAGGGLMALMALGGGAFRRRGRAA